MFELDWLMQENIPIEEVLKCLNCTREGLKTKEIQERLDLFGYNKLEEKNVRTPVETTSFFSSTFVILFLAP